MPVVGAEVDAIVDYGDPHAASAYALIGGNHFPGVPLNQVEWIKE